MSDRHAWTCAGAIHDLATGELVDVQRGRRRQSFGHVGGRTLWGAGDTGVVVLDEALRVSAPIELRAMVSCVGRGSGDELVISTATRVVAIDLTRATLRELEGASKCANATAITMAEDGALRCVVERGARAVLRTIGREDEREVSMLRDVRFAGDRLIGMTPAARTALVVIARDGTTTSRTLTDGARLLDVRGQSALLGTDAQVLLARLDDPAVPVEVVLAERAQGGFFAGEDLILASDTQSVVWLRRGATITRPRVEVVGPSGFTALRPRDEGISATWVEGTSEYARHPDDVAAFERPGEDAWAFLVVSRVDRSELARFEGDDAAWGRALMGRYVDHGQERTGRVYRDASGVRVMRGHSYIGGCERSHIELRIRELPSALELWTLDTGTRNGVDRILGAVPRDARAIDDGWSDGYAGDPSIGVVEP